MQAPTLYERLVQIDQEALEAYQNVEITRQKQIGEAYKMLDDGQEGK